MATQDPIEEYNKNLNDGIDKISKVLGLIFPIDFNSQNISQININKTSYDLLQNKNDSAIKKQITDNVCKQLVFLMTDDLVNQSFVLNNVSLNSIFSEEQDLNKTTKIPFGFQYRDQAKIKSFCDSSQEVQQFKEYIFAKIKLLYYLKQISKDNFYEKLIISSKPEKSQAAKNQYNQWTQQILKIIKSVLSDQIDTGTLNTYIRLFEETDPNTVQLCKEVVKLCAGAENITDKQTSDVCQNSSILSVKEDICNKEELKQAVPVSSQKSYWNAFETISKAISLFQNTKARENQPEPTKSIPVIETREQSEKVEPAQQSEEEQESEEEQQAPKQQQQQQPQPKIEPDIPTITLPTTEPLSKIQTITLPKKTTKSDTEVSEPPQNKTKTEQSKQVKQTENLLNIISGKKILTTQQVINEVPKFDIDILIDLLVPQAKEKFKQKYIDAKNKEEENNIKYNIFGALQQQEKLKKEKAKKQTVVPKGKK